MVLAARFCPMVFDGYSSPKGRTAHYRSHIAGCVYETGDASRWSRAARAGSPWSGRSGWHTRTTFGCAWKSNSSKSRWPRPWCSCGSGSAARHLLIRPFEDPEALREPAGLPVSFWPASPNAPTGDGWHGGRGCGTSRRLCAAGCRVRTARLGRHRVRRCRAAATPQEQAKFVPGTMTTFRRCRGRG